MASELCLHVGRMYCAPDTQRPVARCWPHNVLSHRGLRSFGNCVVWLIFAREALLTLVLIVTQSDSPVDRIPHARHSLSSHCIAVTGIRFRYPGTHRLLSQTTACSSHYTSNSTPPSESKAENEPSILRVMHGSVEAARDADQRVQRRRRLSGSSTHLCSLRGKFLRRLDYFAPAGKSKIPHVSW
jgi:hypothetical protein